jgi:hypothetical protein
MLTAAHAFHSERAIEAIVEREADIVISESQDLNPENGEEYSSCAIYLGNEMLVIGFAAILQDNQIPFDSTIQDKVTVLDVGDEDNSITLRTVLNTFDLYRGFRFLEEDESGYFPEHLLIQEEEELDSDHIADYYKHISDEQEEQDD